MVIIIIISSTGAAQLNEPSSAVNTVEDAAAVSAISKQQILVQYLKVSFRGHSTELETFAVNVLLPQLSFL